jgi:hypothetical protein
MKTSLSASSWAGIAGAPASDSALMYFGTAKYTQPQQNKWSHLMKVGDLIRHKQFRQLAIVLRSQPTGYRGKDPKSIHAYIDLVWLDDGEEDSAYSGLFEVVNAAR